MHARPKKERFKVKKEYNFIQDKRKTIQNLQGRLVEIKHANLDPAQDQSLPDYYAGKILGLTREGFFFDLRSKKREITLSLFGLISITELKKIK